MINSANTRPQIDPRDYFFRYHWMPVAPPLWFLYTVWVFMVALLLTPALLAPGIEQRAEDREAPFGELPSVATYIEQIPEISKATAAQRAVLPDELRTLSSRLYGLLRLDAENSPRGYTHRFAATTFTPQPDQSWYEFFNWISQPRMLLKGSLIVLVLVTPFTILRMRNISSPANRASPILRIVADAGLSQFMPFCRLALRLAGAAAIVGFGSELISLLFWAILTAVPATAIFFGVLFSFCGILPVLVLAMRIWCLLALMGGGPSDKLSEEFEWNRYMEQFFRENNLNWASLLRMGQAVASVVAGLSVSIWIVVAGPRKFPLIEHRVSELCDPRGITWQPAVAVLLLLVTTVALWRWLPPECRHISYRLRQAIRLTRIALQERLPHATGLWHTCCAVRLLNGSCLVSVRTTQEKKEPVFLVWDGEEVARYVGQRQRERNDFENSTNVPRSKQVISDLSQRLDDRDPVRLAAAIRDTRGLRGTGEPLVPLLVRLLTVSEANIRALVCEAIGYVGGAPNAQTLASCLSDPDREVRYYAVSSLGQLRLGHDVLETLLSQAKDDPDPAVRSCVDCQLSASEQALKQRG